MTERGRRARWSGPLLLAMGLTTPLAACGGNPPPPSAPDALPGSPPELEEALLTTSELGEGWIDLGAVPLEERGLRGCPEGQVITAGEDAARRGEAQSTYAEGKPPAPTFGESVSLWESADVASERLATFASMASECRSFEEELLDGRRAVISVVQRNAPPLGDQAVALELRADAAEGPTVSSDVVLVRLGSVLVLTEGQRVDGDPDVSLDQERLDELTGRAVEKAEETLAPS